MQIVTVAIRVIQQLIKDKRTLAFLLLAPVFVLGLLYFIMSSASNEATIGVIDIDNSLHNALENEAKVIDYDTKQQAFQAMKKQNIDAYFYMEDNKPYIEIEGADITKKSLVIQSIQSSMQTYQKERSEELKLKFEDLQNELNPLLENIQQQTDKPINIEFPNTNLSMKQPKINYLYNDENSDLFDQVAPALMGFLYFYLYFLLLVLVFCVNVHPVLWNEHLQPH